MDMTILNLNFHAGCNQFVGLIHISKGILNALMELDLLFTWIVLCLNCMP